jgi:hypothetical protein
MHPIGLVSLIVMAGFVPVIHVDDRDKPGHDERSSRST